VHVKRLGNSWDVVSIGRRLSTDSPRQLGPLFESDDEGTIPDSYYEMEDGRSSSLSTGFIGPATLIRIGMHQKGLRGGRSHFVTEILEKGKHTGGMLPTPEPLGQGGSPRLKVHVETCRTCAPTTTRTLLLCSG
jgi:hypothetical protein